MLLKHKKSNRPEGRILAVGDIHGCADTLESLLDQIGLMHDDHITFLGDYIDRGNKVFEVIERLIALREEYGDDVCTFIMGNHEEMFSRYLKDTGGYDGDRMFRYNGGTSTINSYMEHLGLTDTKEIPLCWDDLPQSHKDFYDNLKVIHEDGEYVFVHAGVRPNVPLDDQLSHDVIWIRDEFLYHEHPIIPDRIIVHGHTPMIRDEIDKYNAYYIDKINIDSGCVFGYDLTCNDLTNGIVYRIKCQDRRLL